MQDLNYQVAKLSSEKRTNQPTGRTESALDSPAPTQADIQLINWLWTQVIAIFPKWRELYPAPEDIKAGKRVWLETLVQQGVTNDVLIKFGLMACRASGYVRPVSPGQFCVWAWEWAMRDARIPPLEDAARMVNRKLASPSLKLEGAMYHLWSILDGHALRSANYKAVRDAVETAHAEVIRHWLSGAPWNEPVNVEPEQTLPHLPTEPTRASRNMQSILAQLEA